MKIYTSPKLTIHLHAQPPLKRLPQKGHIHRFIQQEEEGEYGQIRLSFKGKGTLHWPNREGESFDLSAAHWALCALGRQESGIHIAYPSTASVPAVALEEKDSLVVFSPCSDSQGRVRSIRVSSPSTHQVDFCFCGTCGIWNLYRIRPPLLSLPPQQPTMHQMGMIAPSGITQVPQGKGFSIISEAALNLAKKQSPIPGSLIHVFGYTSGGHDCDYPHYTPASQLGGASKLTQALHQVQDLGYQTSLYMNARLARLECLVENSHLIPGALCDERGQWILEHYGKHDFVVMDPAFPAWQTHLISQAKQLKEYGAQWVQLDQMAGRATPLPPASPWGKGNRQLIDEMHLLGLKVWIQGISDYYPADAFEATWRPVSVLDDGTLRGGTPLGQSDTTLIETLGFRRPLIIPRDKTEIITSTSLPIITDLTANRDELPLWNPQWAQHIRKNPVQRETINGGIL
ncbi:MAG: DUF6259 domain-containing protein [Spirochaetales bacterium]|nr:DUF6259 domain-containing protein [Spirochaetales bacterium]